MAPLDATGTRSQQNVLRIIVFFMLIGLMLVLGYRECTSRRNPTIQSLMALLNESRESAVSSEMQKRVEFDLDENKVILKTAQGDAEPKVEKTFEMPNSYRFSLVSFPDNTLIFGPDGPPNSGGEIVIIEYKKIIKDIDNDEEKKVKKTTSIEISPSDGEVWILDDEYTAYNRFGAWIGAICVIAIFSYLYKENQFYRVFEHILLGVSIGFSSAIVIYQVLYTKWFLPMTEQGFALLIKGDRSKDIIFNCCLLFPALIGMLWFFQYSKKYLWLNRIAVGVTAGAAAGLGIKHWLVSGYPQITETFYNLFVTASRSPHLNALDRWRISFENILMLVIVCCVIYYFFFSFRRKSDLSKTPANMGRLFLMISLGAFFGNTFLTRVIILIDRIQFLLEDWLMVT